MVFLWWLFFWNLDKRHNVEPKDSLASRTDHHNVGHEANICFLYVACLVATLHKRASRRGP